MFGVGERPVPTGTQTCSSDRDQYLETGELNGEEEPIVPSGPAGAEPHSHGHNNLDHNVGPARQGPGPSHRGGDRSMREREWDSQSSKYYGGRGGGHPDEEDEPPYRDMGRPYSRNDYYAREREMEYRRGGRELDRYDNYNRQRFNEYNNYPPFNRPGRGDPRAWDYMDSSRHNSSFQMDRSYGGRYPNNGPAMVPPKSDMGDLVRYLEELRIRDRATYRHWYEKYLVHSMNPNQIPFPIPPGYQLPVMGGMPYPNFRHGHAEGASFRSGRSSATNEELNLQRTHRDSFHDFGSEVSFNQQDFKSLPAEFKPIIPANQEFDQHSSSRSTPMKFVSDHSIGVMSPMGQLMTIRNGGTSVEVCSIKQVMSHLPEYKEIEAFPGPLVKGKTHKHNVIQFCEKKIREAQSSEERLDQENFILIWELLILLLRQNGSVIGSDISELLSKKRQRIETSEESEGSEVGLIPESIPNKCETEKTERFCDLLLYGHQKDALVFAMDNSLWGHALFLASKMGEREYGHVMSKFISGMASNHPLQTLYQLMNGKQPSSATACCEESFGDWRPHLSMILSNSGSNVELEQKTIITLGDTLSSANHFYAAQFCYLMAKVDFASTTKLGPLLGLSPGRENIMEATQMTEIYQFARSLAESDFNLGLTWMDFKFTYTKSLIDYGFVQEAFVYCEELSKQLLLFKDNEEGNVSSLKWGVLQISQRLQHFEESGLFVDLKWVENLKDSLYNKSSGKDLIETESVYSTSSIDGVNATQPNTARSGVSEQSSIPHSTPRYDGSSESEYHQTDARNFNNEAQPIPEAPIYSYENNQHQENLYAQNGHPEGINGPSETQTAYLKTEEAADHPNIVPSGISTAPPALFNVQVPAAGNSWNQESGGNYSQPPPPLLNHPEQQMYNPSQHQPLLNQSQPQPMLSQPPLQSIPNQMIQQPMQNQMVFDSNSHGNYQPTFQQQPLGNGPMSFDNSGMSKLSNTGYSNDTNYSQKKKTVRFEDDKNAKESKIIQCASVDHRNPSETCIRNRSSFKTILRDSSSECESAARLENEDLSDDYDDDCDDEVDELQPNSDTAKPKVVFRSTFPIDLACGPLPKYSSTNSKTYQIDKKCCEANKPCKDHVSYGNSPTSHRPTSAGPNVLGHDKPPPLNPQDPKSEKGEDSKTKKDKPSSTPKGPGLFSSLINKLPFRGGTQMKLPDDKNPPITWDDAKGWVDEDGNPINESSSAPPPPTDMQLMGMNPNSGGMAPPPQLQNAPPNMYQQMAPTPNSNGQTPFPPNNNNLMRVQPIGTGQPIVPPSQGQNKYSLGRGRLGVKNSYVDILKPGGGGMPQMPQPANNQSQMPMPPMFTPGPPPPGSGDSNFLTPSYGENPTQLAPSDGQQPNYTY